MTFSTDAERKAYARGLKAQARQLLREIPKDAFTPESTPWQRGFWSGKRYSAGACARRARQVEEGGKR